VVSVFSLSRILCGLWLLSWCLGCAGGARLSRESLADPMMRFDPPPVPRGPGEPRAPAEPLLAPNTVASRVVVSVEPGSGSRGTWTESNLRAAVEIVSGLALEAGYGMSSDRHTEYRLDGFAGPQTVKRVAHGPDAAVVLDDGTSLLRLGYRFRTAWDGPTHEPSVMARSSILGRDTILEVGYSHRMQSVNIGADRHPARDPIDDDARVDRFSASLEQGFVPGINIRIDFLGIIEEGFLSSPYRLVTLWSQRDPQQDVAGVPRAEPENHPRIRHRLEGLVRLRKTIGSRGVVEAGAGYGRDNWRVEHESLMLGFQLRLFERWVARLGAGGWHQTRAAFYRNDYPYGPPGAYWSADRRLSSYWAWWAESGLRLLWLAEDRRVLGLFRHLAVDFGFCFQRVEYGWEGMAAPNGFSGWTEIGGPIRSRFDGGQIFQGLLAIEGGF